MWGLRGCAAPAADDPGFRVAIVQAVPEPEGLLRVAAGLTAGACIRRRAARYFWRKANTPRLLATITSGLPSAFRSATVTCVPTPLSSSIFSAT